MQPDYLELLKRYWGYDAFRGIQEEIIRSIGEDRDTLGLMPTGGGKSITFQLPALAREGLCLVITPLIALMKDQVENLRKRGIRALAIHSGMDRQEILRILENCIFGDYKFLYLSPERLDTELFLAKLPKMHVSLITVDESHCISQWGYDFRPAYLKIAGIRDLLPGVPVLALTATATPEVAKDIQLRLRFRRENLFRMSFERKNLAYIVRATENKTGELLHILRRIPGSAIVYVRNRRRTKEVTELLQGEDITATFYHAGLEDGVKERRQRAWSAGEVRVMVATNAFGMGIDKPDVRVVIHMDLPDAIEAYFQEAGRAGRDGQRAYAILLYAKSDRATLHKRVPDNFPEKAYIKTVYEHLQYYYEMAMGDGQDCVREFNIEDFCRKFKHPPLPTDSALKILTQAGYIEYTGEQENASRLLFTLRRDELYKLHGMEEDTDRLIQAVLRSYTGLFTDYAFINEDSIAMRTGLTRRQVYEKLIALNRLRIVSYIPRKKIPYIIYTRARVEADTIRIPSDIYEARKERYIRRIDAMLAYATNDTVCRSRLLLRYFGEKNEHDCGLCDTCVGRRHTAPTLAPDELCRLVKERLAATPLTPAALAELVPAGKDDLLEALHELLDAGELVTENGLLRLPQA